MNKSLFLWGLVIGAALLISAQVWAQEGDGGQKKYGVIHNIAEDRLVERVGGIYEPEGIDKYMKRRFDDLAAQINRLDSRMAQMESQIARILQIAEAAVSEEDVSTAASSQRPAPAAQAGGRGILVGSSGRTEILES